MLAGRVGGSMEEMNSTVRGVGRADGVEDLLVAKLLKMLRLGG
jgi:hypothetical protein